jgi:hypothetical protein
MPYKVTCIYKCYKITPYNSCITRLLLFLMEPNILYQYLSNYFK